MLNIIICEDAFMTINIGGPDNILLVVRSISPRFSLGCDVSCALFSTFLEHIVRRPEEHLEIQMLDDDWVPIQEETVDEGPYNFITRFLSEAAEDFFQCATLSLAIGSSVCLLR